MMVTKLGVAAGLLAVTGCASAQVDSTIAAEPRTFDAAYAAGEARRLETGAGGLLYIERGGGEGAPVVFFMPELDYRYWQIPLEEAARAHRAIAFSFVLEPWSGPPPDDPTPEGGVPGMPVSTPGVLPGPLYAPLIPALEALREELGFDRVHFVTHSIGGRFALEVAAVRPDLFASLVLEEPAGGVVSPDVAPAQPSCTLEDVPLLTLELCEFINAAFGPGYFEAFEAQPEPVRRYFQDIRDAQARSLPPGPDGPVAPFKIDPALIFPPICEEIGRLSMPILVVRGAETPAAFQSGLDYYEACLPAHETIVVEGVTHNVHFDAPEAFNHAVMKFLSRHPM